MQFKQYPSYKNSGVEWLGDVPEHWQQKPIWSLFKRIKRTNFPTERLLSVYRDYGVIPKDSRDDNHNRASEDLTPYQLVCANDLVINKMKAWQGSIAISELRGIVSPAYYIYQPKAEYHSKYIHFLIRSAYYIQSYKNYSKGIRVNQWDLESEAFTHIDLLLPSLDEQQKIVAFLDTETTRIDNLITKQEKLIELLEEQRKSIISHAVTKGLNPNAPMKDSGVEWLGEVPEHWNLKPIKFLAKTNQLTLAENTDEDFEIQYVDIGSVSITNGIEKIETILFKDAPSRARRIVKDGDIIVSTVRTYLKAIAYIENPPKNLIVSTGFAVLNPIRTVISPQYAKFTFLAEQFIAEVIAKSKGISYPAITATELADIKIALPPLNEQKVILQYLLEENLKMNKLISKQNQLIEKLKEYRASIISHAVTGKIDVREFDA